MTAFVSAPSEFAQAAPRMDAAKLTCAQRRHENLADPRDVYMKRGF